MKYNLKITSKQSWIIQCHILDLCNFMLSYDKSFEDIKKRTNNFKSWDEYDVLRAGIYFKEKRISRSYIQYVGLTKEELDFIGHEIDYWVFSGFDREPKERQMAKRILDNIKNINDTQYQRNLILEDILK